LLRAALTDATQRASLAGRLRPEQFGDPRHRRLAEFLFSVNGAGSNLRDDPELESLASRLQVDESGPPVTPEGVEEALRRIERLGKLQRRRELEAESATRTLSDAERDEYQQLLTNLGQGCEGR
jgi:hypothetical protein